MPAIFVHFIHGYLIYGLKGGIFGMLPDLLSFGRLGIAITPKKFKHIIKGNFKEIFKKPKDKDIREIDELLYKLFHSIVIWGIIYYFSNRDKEFLCLFLAIFIDIFMHQRHFFGTPFLFPISDYKFDGINWNTKLGWIIAVIITFFIYKYSDLIRKINKSIYF
jgi:hypothetical protein